MKGNETNGQIKTEEIQDAPGWYYGEVDEYMFHAKVSDNKSDQGINEGRVTMLFVYHSQDTANPIMDFQRGWEIPPRGRKLEALLTRILEHLEKLSQITT